MRHIMVKLKLSQYPATHTSYMLYHCTNTTIPLHLFSIYLFSIIISIFYCIYIHTFFIINVNYMLYISTAITLSDRAYVI